MKMRILKTVLSGVCLAGMLMVTESANADSVTLGVGISGTDIIGEVIPGVSGSDGGGQLARDQIMVNQLIGMTAPSSQSVTVGGGTYQFNRSANTFGLLPSASTTGVVFGSGVGTGIGQITVDGTSAIISLSTAFHYLIAAYDGGSGGAEVWDISNIAAGSTIYIPEFAQPLGTPQHLTSSTKFQITTWTLFNPTSTPDGGSTVALLGFALLGIGAVRNKFSRN